MNAMCQTCHHHHLPTWVYAEGRFHRNGPIKYRARIPDAPLRATRAEAMADACAAMAGGAV